MRGMIVHILMLVAIIALGVEALGQESPASILSSLPPIAQYNSYCAVNLVNDEFISVSPDGTITDVIHKRVLVLNPSAASDYTDAVVFYDDRFQSVHLDYARTIRPNGHVVYPSPRVDVILSQEAGDAMTPPDNHFRVLNSSLSATDKGAIVDWQVTIHGKSTQTPGKFGKVWYLLDSIPTIERKLSLKLPSRLPFRWRAVGTSFAPAIQTGSNTVTYTFSMRDLPASSDDDLGRSGQSPRIIVSTIESWDDVALALRKLFTAGYVADDFVTTRATDMIMSATTQQEKVDTLYSFVSQEIEYSDFPHTAEPYPAKTTFAYKRGACRDQAALLITMLKVAGVKAYPAFLSSSFGTDIDLSLPPTTDMFDHVIVAVQKGDGWRFLDPSSASWFYSVDYLPDQDRDKHAFIVLDEGEKPWIEVETDKSSPDLTYIHTTANFSLTADGSLTGSARSVVGGEEAARLRVFCLSRSNDRLQDAVKGELLSAALPTTTLTSLSIKNSNLYEPKDPITFDVSVNENGFVLTSGTKDYIRVPLPPLFPCPGEVLGAMQPYGLGFLQISSPRTWRGSVRLDLPAGMTVLLPEGKDVVNEAGSFHSSYYIDEAGALIVERVLKIDPSDMLNVDRHDLQALYLALHSDLLMRIVLVDSSSAN